MERKIRELRYAIALEKQFSKDQILERYLNIAYYGEGAYGVEAAARHYYTKHADELDLAEAAMLAGLVQNPDANNPVNNLERGHRPPRRGDQPDGRAEDDHPGAGQEGEGRQVRREEVKPTRNGCVGTKYPFLCDYVYRTLLKTPSLGKTAEERENMVKRGGLTIQTAIDPKTQNLAQRRSARSSVRRIR